MAGLNLLDGTIAAVDFTLSATTASPTQVSIKCAFSYVSLMYRRPTTVKTTFCSAGWTVPIPGIRSGFGHLDGYVATGASYTSPLLYFNVDTPLPFVFTADTGNTNYQSRVMTQEAMGARALGEFARGSDFETSGSPTVVWVIT
jgi:hypothetical protein